MASVVLRSTLRRWSPLPLRMIVGYGFIAHGYAKIANGPEHFAASLHALRAPASHAMAWATIAFEVIGGFAVLAGAFVPLVSLPLDDPRPDVGVLTWRAWTAVVDSAGKNSMSRLSPGERH